MQQRVILIFLSLMLLVSFPLFARGGSENTEESADAAKEDIFGSSTTGNSNNVAEGGASGDSLNRGPKNTYLVVYIPNLYEISWYRAMQAGIQSIANASESLRIKLLGFVQETGTSQTNYFETIVAERPDAIIIVDLNDVEVDQNNAVVGLDDARESEQFADLISMSLAEGILIVLQKPPGQEATFDYSLANMEIIMPQGGRNYDIALAEAMHLIQWANGEELRVIQ